MSEDKQFKSFDEYVSEAELPPFELPVSEDKTLVFDAPTGARIEQFAGAYREGDLITALWALAGDNWDELEDLTANKHWRVRNDILNDMVRHFKLVPDADMELRNATGAKVIESDPDKIQALQKAGFKIVGESQPRS